MTKIISLKRHKELMINSQETLDRVLRIYPVWIQQEIDNPRPKSPEIIKDLQKRLDAAREIFVIRRLQGVAPW